MKICFLAPAEVVHTQKWIGFFVDKGYEVHLFSSDPFRPPFYSDSLRKVKYHDLRGVQNIFWFRFLFFFLGPFKLLGRIGFRQIYLIRDLLSGFFKGFWLSREIEKIKPDILHSHCADTYGFPGAVCGFHPHVLTIWGHDIYEDLDAAHLSKWMSGFALKRSDMIICGGEHMIERMVKLGALREKININYFGVDVQRFSPRQKDERFKESLNINPQSPVVISIRLLKQIYDVESLIRAVPLVLKEVPEAKFVVAGDGGQRRYLEGLASSLGVSNDVLFVGRIPSHEVPRYLASSDVYVSTSLSDGGLSGSTAEAMASELPVVITDFGDNGKWVKDGEGGFIVPPGAPSLLAEKIIYLLKNENIWKKFGQLNRKIIEEGNNYDREMGKVERIYQRLISERGYRKI